MRPCEIEHCGPGWASAREPERPVTRARQSPWPRADSQLSLWVSHVPVAGQEGEGRQQRPRVHRRVGVRVCTLVLRVVSA